MLNAGQEAGLMVSENALSAICAPPAQLSVVRTVKFDVPATVGIPEIRPAELIFIPGGKEPESILKPTGTCPPVALNWYEYA